MNTTENNKLIAEFMGAKRSPHRFSPDNELVVPNHGLCVVDTLDPRYGKILKYHTSWDWLMPVVGKIEEINGITVHIIGRSTSILRNGSGERAAFNKHSTHIDENPIREMGDNKLEGCYNAVVEFIKRTQQ